MDIQATFGQYNDYIAELFAPQDDALAQTLADMAQEEVPAINVSATGGKFLQLMVRVTQAKRILEVGTLGGYSAIWMARALPTGGKLVTLELSELHARVARANILRAGLSDVVEIRVGAAADTLRQMHTDGEPVFDMVFIDADKPGYIEYLELAMPLLREGGLLMGDNTLPDAVLTADGDSPTKRYNTAVAARADLESTIVPTLRSRGIDGLTISVKTRGAA